MTRVFLPALSGPSSLSSMMATTPASHAELLEWLDGREEEGDEPLSPPTCRFLVSARVRSGDTKTVLCLNGLEGMEIPRS